MRLVENGMSCLLCFCCLLLYVEQVVLVWMVCKVLYENVGLFNGSVCSAVEVFCC